MCDRADPGAVTSPGWPGRLLRLAAGYGARRDALEPLLRLMLDMAAVAALLRRRPAGRGGPGQSTAVRR